MAQITVKSRQPKSLNTILCNQFLNWLRFTWSTHLENAEQTQQVKDYLQALPVTVRSHLLDRGIRSCIYRNYIKSPHFSLSHDTVIFLIKVLSGGVDRFVYEGAHCLPAEYLEDILEILLKETNSLKVLKILKTGSAILNRRNESLLQATLFKNYSISQLSLHWICTDNILTVIGRNCNNLQFLDISNSSSVTDKGMYFLTQTRKCCCNDKKQEERSDAINDKLLSFMPEYINSGEKFCGKYVESSHQCSFVRYKTKLCQTLRYIIIRQTHISGVGMRILFVLIKHLNSIGRNHLDDFLDNVYEDYQKTTEKGENFTFPILNVRGAYVWNLTEGRLKILTTSCRSISVVTIGNVCCSISELTNIPSIRKLRFNGDIGCDVHTVATSFVNYVEHCGDKLTELTMKNYKVINKVSLSWILHSCPNLEILFLGNLFYYDSENEILNYGLHPVKFSKLKQATLHVPMKAEDVRLFLKSSILLESVEFAVIVDEHEFLLSLCEKPLCISETLTSFVVETGHVMSNLRDVAAFKRCYQHIRYIGHVKYTLEDLKLGKDVDLKLI